MAAQPKTEAKAKRGKREAADERRLGPRSQGVADSAADSDDEQARDEQRHREPEAQQNPQDHLGPGGANQWMTIDRGDALADHGKAVYGAKRRGKRLGVHPTVTYRPEAAAVSMSVPDPERGTTSVVPASGTIEPVASSLASPRPAPIQNKVQASAWARPPSTSHGGGGSAKSRTGHSGNAVSCQCIV